MNELEELRQLPDPRTGELLPATPSHAARVRVLAAEVIATMRRLQADCDEVLAEEAQRQGTKTLHLDGRTVVLTGGVSTDYDAHELMAGLMQAGCPPDRVNQAVQEIVSYKVNRAVLRQLAGANEEYADAIDRAETRKETLWKARVT